uniref:Jupiter microtubule associated homolog 1b n=1 Tax=Salmo trutta TaxID=8032 RepID=A0A674DTP4_SALTR
MTTTKTFQGMDPGAKSSSRVLRPPGGASNISFGTDEAPPVRKNKMGSNIFLEPDDPHAHRRSNPPGGTAKGTLCGEPSAPLRRCQQPLLFPKNNETDEVITSINVPLGVEECQQANNGKYLWFHFECQYFNIWYLCTVPVKSLDTYSFKGFSLFLLFSTL